jgi:HEAT repeat protein
MRSRHKHKKMVVITGLVMVIGVLIAVGVVWKDRLTESWSIRQLSSESEDTVRSAAGRLVRMRSVRGLPHLARVVAFGDRFRRYALRSHDESLRVAAVEALGIVRARSEDSVPALTEALQYPNPRLRSEAARALGRFGEEAAPALPSLEALLAEKDAELRQLAVQAMGAIGGGAASSVPRIAEVLGDPLPTLRESAARALGEIGPSAVGALPALGQAANDVDPRVQRAAVEAIGHLGPRAAEAAARILERARKNPVLRQAAQTARERLGITSDGTTGPSPGSQT